MDDVHTPTPTPKHARTYAHLPALLAALPPLCPHPSIGPTLALQLSILPAAWGRPPACRQTIPNFAPAAAAAAAAHNHDPAARAAPVAAAPAAALSGLPRAPPTPQKACLPCRRPPLLPTLDGSSPEGQGGRSWGPEPLRQLPARLKAGCEGSFGLWGGYCACWRCSCPPAAAGWMTCSQQRGVTTGGKKCIEHSSLVKLVDAHQHHAAVRTCKEGTQGWVIRGFGR
eukprot:1160753-Pelagomonas_calceolata.AAC.4